MRIRRKSRQRLELESRIEKSIETDRAIQRQQHKGKIHMSRNTKIKAGI